MYVANCQFLIFQILNTIFVINEILFACIDWLKLQLEKIKNWQTLFDKKKKKKENTGTFQKYFSEKLLSYLIKTKYCYLFLCPNSAIKLLCMSIKYS